MLFKLSLFAESQGFTGKLALLRCCLLAEASGGCHLPGREPQRVRAGLRAAGPHSQEGTGAPCPHPGGFLPASQLSSCPSSHAAFAKPFPKGWLTERGSRNRRQRTSSTSPRRRFASPPPAAGGARLSCALLAAGSAASLSCCVLARRQQRSQLGCLLPRCAVCIHFRLAR